MVDITIEKYCYCRCGRVGKVGMVEEGCIGSGGQRGNEVVCCGLRTEERCGLLTPGGVVVGLCSTPGGAVVKQQAKGDLPIHIHWND